MTRDRNLHDLEAELRADPEYDAAFTTVELVRNVSQRLKQMRERAGMTQSELAGRLGISPARIWQLESGTLRDAPSLKTIARWAHACGEFVTLSVSGEDVPSRGFEPAGIASVGDLERRRDRVVAAARAAQQAAESVLAEGAFDHPVVVAGEPEEHEGHLQLSVMIEA